MKMVRESKIIDVELDANIRLRSLEDIVKCVIRNIASDYTDIMAVSSDPRVCRREGVVIDISDPADDQPIRCSGRIIWHLESDDWVTNQEKYLVRIFIIEISRRSQERLDQLIARKYSSDGNGYGCSFIL